MNLDDKITLDLYNQAPFGYLTTKKDGTIIKVNDTLLRLVKRDRAELLGKKRFQDLITVGGRIYYETHFFPLLIYQKEVKEINFEIRNSEGQKIPVLVNTTVVFDKDEQMFLLSTVVDISQRKLYEKELFLAKEKAQEYSKKLEEANNDLLNFIQVLTHDVKTPLINILGLFELFERGVLSNDSKESGKYISLVKNSTNSLLDLIEGILKYHINSNIENQLLELINIEDLFRKIALIADPESKIELTFTVEETTINSYAVIVEMILLNLLVNAIKYNDKDTIKVKFSVSSDHQFYYFTISDNGVGIDAKDFQRIFESSKTLGLKDRFNSKGTGLGLSYVKKMVEKLGGTISVQSLLGLGSSFVFTIKKPIQ